MSTQQAVPNRVFLTLLVATLGYFVDVYDIWVFAAVRVTSLTELGLSGSALLDAGILLLNAQMTGMLLGGVLFGIAGDRFGRSRVMFLSILTYSLATLANAFVQDVTSYAALRFISGFGLAGELGLGATLISETLSKERRGLGIGMMVGLGVCGALAAGAFAQMFEWRTCYIIGGVMGLALLVLRTSRLESTMFKAMEHHVAKGDIRLLFSTKERITRFICCLMLGLPTWFVYGVLLTFSSEITSALGVAVIATPVLMVYCNIALPAGDIASVGISQLFKSRRAVYVGFMLFALAALLALFFLPRPLGQVEVIALYAMMSFGIGAWVLMTLIATEVFGTNLRATVATSVPSFARASVIPLTLSLTALKGSMPLQDAVLFLGLVSFTLPLLALSRLPETFNRELNYVEENAEEKEKA